MIDNSLRDLVALGQALALGVFFAPIVLLALAIPYAVLRVQDSTRPEHDPQLGLKTALYFMYSLSILMILIGLTIYAIDLGLNRFGAVNEELKVREAPQGAPQGKRLVLEKAARKDLGTYLTELSPVKRTSYALIVAGLVFFFFHLVVIVGWTNQRRWPEARRVFVGWRFAIHSLVVFSDVTVVIWYLFQKDPERDWLVRMFAILAVWLPSWILHLILLRLYRGIGSKPKRRPDGIPEVIPVS
jgi:hypothetical protein